MVVARKAGHWLADPYSGGKVGCFILKTFTCYMLLTLIPTEKICQDNVFDSGRSEGCPGTFLFRRIPGHSVPPVLPWAFL